MTEQPAEARDNQVAIRNPRLHSLRWLFSVLPVLELGTIPPMVGKLKRSQQGNQS